ncbi:MAG: hypothetical protein RI897_1765 [Verrucomicrobiota bacterium]
MKDWGEAGMGLKLLVMATRRGEKGVFFGVGCWGFQSEGVSQVAWPSRRFSSIWLDWRMGAKLSEATRDAPTMRPRPEASEGLLERRSWSFCQRVSEAVWVPASMRAMILEEKELK